MFFVVEFFVAFIEFSTRCWIHYIILLVSSSQYALSLFVPKIKFFVNKWFFPRLSLSKQKDTRHTQTVQEKFSNEFSACFGIHTLRHIFSGQMNYGNILTYILKKFQKTWLLFHTLHLLGARENLYEFSIQHSRASVCCEREWFVCCFIPWLNGSEKFFVAFNRLNLNNLICHIISIHAVNKL